MELPSDNVSETSEFQQKFESKLAEYESQHQGSLRKPWTEERVLEVMNHIRQAKVSMSSNQRRTSMEYYWTSKYDIVTIADKEYLIFKRNSPNEPTVCIVSRNDYFHILMEAHIACGHGGRDKIIHATKSKFYIPKKAIEFFLALCPTCENKKNLTKKSVVAQPLPTVSQDVNSRRQISQDFNIQGQVDLIDFRFSPDGEFRWLLIYQDKTTKFLSLRALKTNSAIEVAIELTKIFMTFGAPSILQSNFGPEFIAKIIVELAALWPECKIGNGSTRLAHRIVQKDNQDVDNMLKAWMVAHNCANWSLGCHFVQYTKNASFHPVIRRSPYKALFGRDPEPALVSSASTVPSSMLINVETEDQLLNLSKHVYSDEPGQSFVSEDTHTDTPHENNCEDATLNDYGEQSSRNDGCAGQAEAGTDQKIISTQSWSGNDLMHSLPQVSDYSHTENPRIPHTSNDNAEAFQAENFNIATANRYEFTIPPPNSSHRSRKRTISDETDDGGDSVTKRFAQNDEFEIYAQYVASELRHTRDLHSALMAKHYINNILFNARMGKYRRSALTSTHEVAEGSIKIERDVDVHISD